MFCPVVDEKAHNNLEKCNMDVAYLFADFYP